MAKSTLLLDAHLKALRLPTFLREYDKVARHCAQEGLDCPRYLFRLCELELLDREQRAIERRIKAAKFPVVKSLETFAFRAIPSLNKRLVLELTRAEYLDRRENVLALGNSGTGKTHLALALGLAACQKSYRVRFTTAAALVNELLEARDDKRLLRFQKQLAKQDLLIVDELGYVPLSKTGAELLFEIFSQRYEQASTLVTSNLPFNEWTEIFGSERLTGALLDRLTHHVHILELNGDSYRLAHSKDTDGNYLAVCRAPEAAENGLRLDALGNLISITVLSTLAKTLPPRRPDPSPCNAAGCAAGPPLRPGPPRGRAQTPLQPTRTATFKHATGRPDGLIFLRHSGLVLVRP